jgi:pilus assembly protein CpaB
MTQKGPEVGYVVASKELDCRYNHFNRYGIQRSIPSDYQQSDGVLATDFGSIDGLPLKVDLKTLGYHYVFNG